MSAGLVRWCDRAGKRQKMNSSTLELCSLSGADSIDSDFDRDECIGLVCA